ncbi:Gamma-tubulin complex component protein [Parasponia andersonii]|uniref:Gamma-tubulin complex component protein n=1 Tax=Parasponia andersonii TaxID=3476 RepID=A0A2P5ASN6_PARAD|nr:Gamma-tubulin complex component protein [Parasponia andersonii]
MPVRSREDRRTDEVEEVLVNNSLDDVTWLCSLSESELDLLISLKMLVLQRAKTIGCEQLAQKFDLKMLRALGLILMEYLKVKVKDKSLVAGLAESAAFMDCCNLLECDIENFLDSEEIRECIGAKSKKRHPNRLVKLI